MQNTIASYHIPDVSVRFATADDLWPMHAVHEIAYDQKNKDMNPANLNQAWLEYEKLGRAIFAKEWYEKGASFLIANVPADKVSLQIPDQNNNMIAGFCMTTFDPKDKNKILHLDKLYSIRNDYPVGSILLDHCIETAQNIDDITAIKLNAPFFKSRQWYKQRALFEEMEDEEDSLLTFVPATNYMILPREKFDAARDKLQTVIAQHERAIPKLV